MKKITTSSLLRAWVFILAAALQFCGSPLGGENKVDPNHCAFKGGECLVLTVTKPQQDDSVGETVLTQGTCTANTTVVVRNDQLQNNPSKISCSSNGSFSGNIKFKSGVTGDQILSFSLLSSTGETNTTDHITVKVGQVSLVAPTVAFPTEGSIVNNVPLAVTGTCEGTTVSIASADLVTNPTTGSCSEGSYTINVQFSTSPASVILKVTSKDEVGTVSPTATRSFTFDATAPTVTVNQSVGQNDPTNGLPIDFDVVFSEPIDIASFTNADITQSGTATGITWSIINSGDDQNFTLRAIAITGDGTVVPSIASGVVNDLGGSGNVISASTDNSVTYDVTNPNVTIEQSILQLDPINVVPIQFDVVFSEPINAATFTTADITQSGTATGITWSIINSGDNQNFTLQATAITGDGTVAPIIAINQVQDLSTNGNIASSSLDNSVLYDSIAPTVTVDQAVGQVDPTNSTPIDFDVVFSEPINVATFTSGDITQSGTATGITWSIVDSGDHQNFTLRATAITGEGTVIPSIPVNKLKDQDGNDNVASSSTDNSVTYDTTDPDVTVNQSVSQLDPTNAVPVQFDVVFSEPINAVTFTTADISQTGTATGITWSIINSGDNQNFTLRATAITGDGTVIPNIGAGIVQDLAGNSNSTSTSTDHSVTYDTSSPSVAIDQSVGQVDPADATPVDFDVVFSEPINVATFTTVDITESGTATGITWSIIDSGDHQNFTLRATAITGDGTVTPSIGASSVQDLAGNGNSVSTSTDNSVTFDSTVPTVTINQAGGQSDPTNSLPILFDIVFSEPINVATFTTADIAQSGTATGITWSIIDSGDHQNFTLRATAITGDGTAIPSIGINQVQDPAGNGNAASTSSDNSVTYDSTPPTVTVNQAGGQSDPTNSLPVEFDIAFSEPINTGSFTTADIAQSGTATGITWSIINSGDNQNFTLRATVVTGDGTIIPSIGINQVQDLAGNGNTGSTSSDSSVTYDSTPPTVTVDQAGGQSDPTNSTPINFAVSFSEPINVATFTSGDITQSGTATGITWSIINSGDNQNFTLRANVITGDGTVIPSVGAGLVQDVAGNGNSVSTSTDNSVTFDATVPTVTVDQGGGQNDPTNSVPIQFDVTFSEPINAGTFTSGDITQSGTATGITWSIINSGDNQNFTLRATVVTGDGTVIPSIAASAVQDPAGNGNAVSTSSDNNVTYDSTPPTVAINQAGGQNDPTNSTPVEFDVTFSEPINTGTFTTADISQSGTATGITWSIIDSGDHQNFTLRATVITGDGTVIPSIAASTVQDSAGNGNAGSTSSDNSVTYDSTGPTVTINQAGGQSDPTNSVPIHFTVSFSEPINTGTFTTADISQSGTATGITWSIIDSGDHQNFTLRATVVTGNGTLIPNISAGIVQDISANTNAGSTSADNSVTYDTVAPSVTIEQSGSQFDPTNSLPIQFDVVFSEAINAATFTTADITQSGTATGITWSIINSGDNQNFTLRATVVTGDGTVIPSIGASTVQDPAGNGNSVSNSSDNSVTYDSTGPTVTINQAGGQSDPTNSVPINFAVVFSEPINTITFTTADITQSGTATGITWSIINSGDNQNFTLRATAVTGNGTLVPSIALNLIQDPAGNNNAASTSSDNSVTYDTGAPTVTVNQAVGQVDPTNVAAISFTVVFSEAINPATFTNADITQSGTATGVTWNAPSTSDNITWTITTNVISTNGTIQPTIAAARVTDLAGNNNLVSTSTDNTVTYDTVAPTVTVNQAVGQVDPTNALPINFTVVFSEAINAATFTTADIIQSGTATGITWSIINVNATTYTLRATAITGDGTLIPSIGASLIQDLAGNNNSVSTSTDNTVTYDITAPTLTVNQAVGQVDPTNALPINFTVVFSEAINAATFTTADITQSGTATGITWSIINVNATTYTLRATAVTGAGTLIPSITATKLTDIAGNNNTASTSTDNSVTRDTTAPTVTVNQTVGQGDPTNNATISFTIVFSEAIAPATFTAADITQSGTATGVTWNTPTTANNITWTITTSAVGTNGTVRPTITASKVTDLAGNNNTASTSTDNTVTYDTVVPTVTINQAAGQADPTNALPINFTAVFSEAINAASFTAADITQSGTATGITWSIVTVSATTYTVRATAVTTNGTLIPSIAASTVQDLAGNNNTVSTSTDNSVTRDTVAPTVTVNQAAGQVDPTTNATISFTIVFSEAINPTTFTAADITQSGTATGVTWNAPTTANNITWTITTSAVGTNGTIRPTIAASRVTDPAGNNNTASTSTDNTVTYDTVAPTVTLNQAAGQLDPTRTLPINFTAVFSEAINAASFTTADITQSGTATGITWSIITVSATTYTVRATAVTGIGTLIPSIGAGLVQDLAGNNSAASTSTDNTITYDNVAPTVTVNQAIGQVDPTNTNTISFTVVFSEPILPATFTTADITQSGTSTGVTWSTPTTSDNITWTITTSAVGTNGTVRPTIAASRVTDPAGNNNAASTSTDNTVTYDTVANPASNVIHGTLWKNTQTSPSITWTAATPGADVNHYDVALGTGTTGGLTSNVVTWTNVGNVTSYGGFSGLSLTECTPYYTSVRMVDNAGNISTVATTVTPFKYDATAPSNLSGLFTNTYALPTKTTKATWTVSTDNCNGLNHYDFAIGTTGVGAGQNDVAAWTNVGNVTTYKAVSGVGGFPVFTLSFGPTYFTSIRAVDSAGNISTSASTGWLLDFKYAAFTSTQTTTGTNLNSAAANLRWTQAFMDTQYFSFTAGSPTDQNITVLQAGDYLVDVTLPVTSAVQRSAIRLQAKVNGTIVQGAIAESSYIRNAGGHNFSSDHLHVLLPGLAANDVVTFQVEQTALAGTVTIDSQALLFIEKIDSSEKVINAEGNSNSGGTNLNTAALTNINWSRTGTDRYDSTTYTHVSGNPLITINQAGDYLVFANIPAEDNTVAAASNAFRSEIQIAGTTINGGLARQGLISRTSGHNNSSVHWSGLVSGVTVGQTLGIGTIRDTATVSNITATTGQQGSLYVQKITAPESASFRGIDVNNGGVTSTNFNSSATARPIRWTTEDTINASYFTHSTGTNPENITVVEDGDYYFAYNDTLNGAVASTNVTIQVYKNGVAQNGYKCSTHYIDNTNSHVNSSCSLVGLLRDVSANDVFTFRAATEAAAGTVTTNGNFAKLFLWKKK